MSPKHKKMVLKVTAVAPVHFVGDDGKIIKSMERVGMNPDLTYKKEPTLLSYSTFYIKHLMDGSLLPADLETAKAAGVKFKE